MLLNFPASKNHDLNKPLLFINYLSLWYIVIVTENRLTTSILEIESSLLVETTPTTTFLLPPHNLCQP
jgi:hypothetical protein